MTMKHLFPILLLLAPLFAGAQCPDTADFIRPPYLQRGDTVGIVAPAGKLPLKTDTAKVRQRFESWGLHVKFGAHCADREQPYFAGTDEERAAAKGLFLLTMKPILYVANVDEDMLNEDLAPIDGVKPLPICAKIEAELSELDPEDAADYLESLGLEQPGLDVLAQAAYKLLGLQSFFTAGEMEVKAWTVRQGATAPQAAGVIHTDFERGFIKAEVIGYDDYIELGGEQGAKAAGKLRIEGKDYVMQDGDVTLFRFNV